MLEMRVWLLSETKQPQNYNLLGSFVAEQSAGSQAFPHSLKLVGKRKNVIYLDTVHITELNCRQPLEMKSS